MGAEAPTEAMVRALDGPHLTRFAHGRGMAPPGVFAWGVTGQLVDEATWTRWQPHQDLAQALALFVALRAQGWSTACTWFGDHRQYGEAWACTNGRAYAVQWPQQVPTEAHALVLCAVLAQHRTSTLPHEESPPCPTI